MDIRETILMGATVTSGLMAGVFFIYAVAVMPGLARVDDMTFVRTFQAIERVIINPLFLLAFLGALILPGVAILLHRGDGHRDVLPWVITGFALYFIAFVVTIVVNAPLNSRLVSAGEPAQVADLAGLREGFERVWVPWNIVRTVLSVAAFGFLAWALTAT